MARTERLADGVCISYTASSTNATRMDTYWYVHVPLATDSVRFITEFLSLVLILILMALLEMEFLSTAARVAAVQTVLKE